MRLCVDCSKPISRRSTRCKSCANRERWAKGDEPRREKLRERNASVRAGLAPYESREWLVERYVERKLSLRQIAKEANCGLRTIARWVKEHGITTRPIGEATAMRARKGEKSPHWKGGLPRCSKCQKMLAWGSRRCSACGPRGSEHPMWKGKGSVYDLLRSWSYSHWRPRVLERDAFTCQSCGETELEALEAHHVEPFSVTLGRKKKELKPDLSSPEAKSAFVALLIEDPSFTSLDNGLTLCHACHSLHHRTDQTVRFGRPRKNA